MVFVEEEVRRMNLFGLSKKVPITKVKILEFSYTNGCFKDSDIIYTFQSKEGKCIASYKPVGAPREEVKEKEVGEDFREKLENILRKNEVGAWDGFDQSNKFVLDGDSFQLFVKFEEGEGIHASGYMEWPKNYREFVKEIAEIYAGEFEKRRE